jgi:hypothetical protein
MIKKGQYDLGFAFDGDADRMIAVTHDGQEVNGDALIYLNSLHLFSSQPALKKKVVITQMSNFGLKKALKEKGIEYLETNVGDKYVQSALKKEQLILGGIGALGAAAYCAWGFLEALKQTRETPEKEKFDWLMATMTVVPGIVAGFLAAYNMEPASLSNVVTVLLAGFGAAGAAGKLGWNSFFRK